MKEKLDGKLTLGENIDLGVIISYSAMEEYMKDKDLIMKIENFIQIFIKYGAKVATNPFSKLLLTHILLLYIELIKYW